MSNIDNLPATFIVNTNYGLVQGILTLSLLNDVFYSFHGVPYAQPPLGDYRFKDPRPPKPWHGIRDATKETPPCWHRDQFSEQYLGSEDCLHLNVYTRNITQTILRPVIVYIHGGAFMHGSRSINSTGPDYLMQNHVVLVTLNFRQGAFGFLSLSDKSFRIPGNAGLKDQSFALRWVKENIRHFGGDPDNVMLFGHSSGGCAVHHHMLSHWSRRLFHKAIVLSGSVLNMRFVMPESREFYAERLASLVGWNGTGGLHEAIHTLISAEPTAIVQAIFQPNFLLPEDRSRGVRFAYGPVVENVRLGFMSVEPRLRARNSWSKRIPVLLSSTSDEALATRRAAAAKGAALLSTIDFGSLIPIDIGRVLSAEERQFAGEQIRKYYFDDENASQEQTLKAYVQMESDRLYVHGMYRMALARLRESPRQSTYMYRFNFDSATMNNFRILNCGRECSGASHGDDLSFIFRNKYVKAIEDIGESEMRTISWLTAILNNFAVSDNPNLEAINVPWTALHQQNRTNDQFKCLNIAKNLSVIDLPELDRMKLWSSFYSADSLI